MTRISINRFAVMSAVVVMLAALLFAGCSKTPMGFDTPDGPQLLTRSSSLVPATLMSQSGLYAEEVISSKEGGVLRLYDVTLTVPAGAVPNDTLFSIAIPDVGVFYNDFGTHGLVFDKPVTVTMSYRDADLTGVDESTIRICWYNERTGKFEDMECEVDQENKVVTGQLEHFSRYGLISD